MSNNYTSLLHLPKLPDIFVNEGLQGNYQYTESPYTYSAPAPLFADSEFCQILTQQFGDILCKYHKNTAYSVYDWHMDKNRLCALNWVIKSSVDAKVFYRTKNHHNMIWSIEELCYKDLTPTLLNTSQQHCVINNSPEERIILSVSIYNNYTFQDVVEFLSSLSITDY